VPVAAPILVHRTVSPARGHSLPTRQAGGNLSQNLNEDDQDKEGQVQGDASDA
jgi:hypothetical protein